MTTPAPYDITIHQGATFEVELQLLNGDSTPTDLTGFTVSGTIWDRLGVRKLAVFASPWVNQASGIFKLRLSSSVTSGITEQGAYDVLITEPDGDTFYLMEGTAFWSPGLSFKS
jgi:hypothetical protein